MLTGNKITHNFIDKNWNIAFRNVSVKILKPLLSWSLLRRATMVSTHKFDDFSKKRIVPYLMNTYIRVIDIFLYIVSLSLPQKHR